ncbi:MAG: phage major capsid protein [Saprospiraceae bacterium]|nr:phage major capsid protein [Saprospiraceae bacterium]
MKIEQLRADYTAKLERQEELLVLTEARDFTPEEETEFDTLTREIKDLTKKIEKENEIEAAKERIAASKVSRGQAKKSEEGKVAEKFSILRAISQMANGVRADQLDGAEGEMHQEAVREAKAKGQIVSGFGVPSAHLRAQDAATAATAGNFIATDLDSTVIPALRPKLVMSSLGATALNGLVGNLDLPAGNAIATATWEGETDQAANTDPSTRLVSLTPTRLAAITTLSKQLMYQSSVDVEAWIRGELSNAIARAVDTAAISGNGSTIDGILGTSGVNEVSFGDVAATRAKLIDLQTAISVENYEAMTMAYLMNPILRGNLQSLKTDTGSGLFVMPDPNTLLGYRAVTTNLVSKVIDTNKTACIFGDFSNVVIGNWGGVDIVIDPYVRAEYGQVRVIINSYWDVALKQPKAFAFGDNIAYTALS